MMTEEDGFVVVSFLISILHWDFQMTSPFCLNEAREGKNSTQWFLMRIFLSSFSFSSPRERGPDSLFFFLSLRSLVYLNCEIVKSKDSSSLDKSNWKLEEQTGKQTGRNTERWAWVNVERRDDMKITGLPNWQMMKERGSFLVYVCVSISVEGQNKQQVPRFFLCERDAYACRRWPLSSFSIARFQ